MIQIKEEKIAEMMFDIWHNSNSLENPVMVGEYIANKLKEAITVTRSSLQLKTENKRLSYDEWKEKLNVQKVEETIYKKGDHFMTINDILEMYNEYCSSF